MRTNSKPKAQEPIFTAGGAQAVRTSTINALRRTVLSCFLWENEFYEDGKSIASRISELASKVSVNELADLAVEARKDFNLRHVSLQLLVELVKRGGSSIVSETIAKVVSRADEPAELLSLYWKANPTPKGKPRAPLSAQLKKGLALAMRKFDAHQLAKYNRDEAVKIRDVLFLVHAKPKDKVQAKAWKELAEGKLASPDTWEVALSGGADKKATFERLLKEDNLGYFALLRNLRNMTSAGVDQKLVKKAIIDRKNGADKILPFRFFAAAKHAPEFERELDHAMVSNAANGPTLDGKTVFIMDVSGSMQAHISGKSEMTRLEAGAALIAVASAACEDPIIYVTAGSDSTRIHKTAKVPSRSGMALRDAIVSTIRTMGGGGIFLTPALRYVEEQEKTADRIIVITDEADTSVADKDKPGLAKPFGSVGNYLINVASYRNGIGYGSKWTHIDGFSEAAIKFITEFERSEAKSAKAKKSATKTAGKNQPVIDTAKKPNRRAKKKAA